MKKFKNPINLMELEYLAFRLKVQPFIILIKVGLIFKVALTFEVGLQFQMMVLFLPFSRLQLLFILIHLFWLFIPKITSYY